MTTTECWCGNRNLTAFGHDYLECACGTLVRATMPGKDITRVRDEDCDLYGRNYWYAHQASLGLPNLDERSASDSRGRCLQWLRMVLAYKTPPGRTLELGAAHGAFVALLAATGFDAIGMELSPWVVEYAKRSWGVRMLLGPVEDSNLEPGTFDLIAAFDVLEHLPDPVGTMRCCANLLRDDGLLILQTPCHQPGVDCVQASSTRFKDMLIPEHLYLFSEPSIRHMLHFLGLSAVSRERSVFETDMVLVAGRQPLPRASAPNAPIGNPSSGAMKIVETLLLLDDAVSREGTDRQRQVEALEARCREAERDREERLQQIGELEARLLQAELDRTDRKQQVQALEERCRETERDRVEQLQQIGGLEARFSQTELDRADRQRQIEALEARCQQADSAGRNHLRHLEGLETERLNLSERHEALRAIAADHRNSRVYKAMVRLGRWRAFDSRLCAALDHAGSTEAPTRGDLVVRTWAPQPVSRDQGAGIVAVDLTAILPGGENGGAKLVSLELVRALSRLAPGRQFLLLTSATSHHEVAALDAPNVRRRIVTGGPTTLSELLEEEHATVLFCPMGAAPFDDPRVSVVCLINDLQFLTYPEFFADAERHARRATFNRAIRTADHLIIPSQYVRSTVLKNSDLSEARTRVIPHTFCGHRLPCASEHDVSETLLRHGLVRERYFIYPANFWPHKNHLMLLVAFGQLCQRRPDLDLRLVLTGATRPDPRVVRESVRRMRLADRVVLPGYVSDAQLSALFSCAAALVFPSLYEGFGIPVLEAFAAGCPVACSNLTSLPQIAAEAALYFDPRNPETISEALERLATSPELREDLRTRGRLRLQEIDAPEQVACEYLHVIDRALSEPRRLRNQIAGVFSDRWTTSTVVVAHAGNHSELHIEVENLQDVAVALTAPGVEVITLGPHQALALRCILPPALLHVIISICPTFRPADYGSSSDTRRLGVRLRACRLEGSGSDPYDLMETITSV